ncbi:MAG TPA: tripartite tricarboxylate transporter substrate binding protein [Roseomonas sp.]|jgi:tripartite-type tricarboxylate transporter receptor subunit TctC
MDRRSLLRRGLTGAAVFGAARSGFAQAPADRVARLIVPYGAGNITDQVARLFVEALAERGGRRLVVDNQPGAGGTLGVVNFVRQPADGNTLAVVSVAAMAIAPHITRPVRYDPFTDLVPVSGISVSSAFLAVHAALPVHSIPELVAHCRARPANDPVFYYSPGNGSVPHLNLEALRRALDFPMQHVPYRSSSAGTTDLLANRVQVTMDSLSLTLPHLQTGALRALAYNGPRRDPHYPDVPTFAEALPEVPMLNAWQGLFYPRGIAPALVERMAGEVAGTLAAPGFADRLPLGVSPFPLSAADLAATIRRDNDRLGRLVADIGLTPD